jgi:hypothetical protein
MISDGGSAIVGKHGDGETKTRSNGSGGMDGRPMSSAGASKGVDSS